VVDIFFHYGTYHRLTLRSTMEPGKHYFDFPEYLFKGGMDKEQIKKIVVLDKENIYHVIVSNHAESPIFELVVPKDDFTVEAWIR